MAHFHCPTPAGKNAGVVVLIDAKDLSSPIQGHATLIGTQARDLLAGNGYFNVHTARIPGDEIRGQVAAAKQGRAGNRNGGQPSCCFVSAASCRWPLATFRR
ncbi:MAG: CHRD domain-containing protein [Rhodanobacter sp.]